MVRKIKANPKIAENQLGKKPSAQTIRNVLKNAGLNGKKSRKKIYKQTEQDYSVKLR